MNYIETRIKEAIKGCHTADQLNEIYFIYQQVIENHPALSDIYNRTSDWLVEVRG